MSEANNIEHLKSKCIEKILKMRFKNSNTKIQNDAVKLSAEVLRIFITECAARAAIQAQNECSSENDITPEVNNQHLEKILPQLLLDF
ncbi:centromere protein X [Trichonephila inaurata madagascariensis]|uniref:Centromere protein X n=1 Tax=Trichonephila inaurata madagascariensis TaxID=2747483 RepID=A0A8X7C4E2_9ARAC|nr:centromere protein X [Trichonephila inaurata madagascariensis]